MSYFINSATFFVNSRDRINGTDSNFSFLLPYSQNANYDRVTVLAMAIPKSYYLIQIGFNTFLLQEDDILTTITIPPGNYSRRSLQTVLISLLNAGSPNYWTYGVSYPNNLIEADTCKFTFSVTGNASQPAIICTENVFEVLGFNTNSTNTFVDNSLTSTNVIKLQLEDTLFLHSDIGSNGRDGIIASIYSAAPDLSILNYTCPDVQAYSRKLVSGNSNVFHFSLLNEDGRIIETNGQNINFIILLWSRENVYNLIRDTIHLSILEKQDPKNPELPLLENDEKNNSAEVI